MPKSVCVILLNWNTPSHTLRCIETLYANCDVTVFDLVVADNGSTDDSLNQFRKVYPDIVYIENGENLGFAEGNNRALKYSVEKGYAYSLLLNTDTEVHEDVLRPLVSYMDQNKEVGAIQPTIYYLHEKDTLWNGGSYFNKFLGITYSRTKGQLSQKTTKVDWITGCCMLVRNSTLKKVGFFTEKFFLYYEDVDLSFRIQQAGYDLVFYPFSKIYHEAGVSGKSASKDKEGVVSPIIHFYNVRNRIWLLRRYGSVIFAPINFLYSAFYYGLLLVYFIVKGKKKKANMLVKGVKEGLLTPFASIWGR